MEKRDVIVIGGGPGGYVAAIRAAQLGAKVSLIEKSTPGGTCVTRGCVPLRALARASELLDLGKAAREYGITYGDPSIDLSKLMARKNTVIRTVSSGVRLLLQGNGIELINGTGRLGPEMTVNVSLPDGNEVVVAGNAVILATGSRCEVPDILKPLGPRVITTDAALEMDRLPVSCAIVGAGLVGLGFASILSRFGVRVTVFGEPPRLLPAVDPEVVSILEKELRKLKIEFVSGAPLPALGTAAKAMADDASASADSELILVSDGRRPNVEDMGLDILGVALNEKGGIKVNAAMQTSVTDVFAVGDVTMGHMSTNVAYAEGVVAAQNAMGMTSKMDYSVLPLCTCTLPELAFFGLTEQQAKEEGYDVRVGSFPFAANAVATTLGQRTGLIKLVADRKYGQILGAHIVGPQASNLIAEAALAAKLEATSTDIASLMHFHPSLSEAVWEVARDSIGQAIHMVSQR
jgi:dihydrolipoamide dehydrogenase